MLHQKDLDLEQATVLQASEQSIEVVLYMRQLLAEVLS